MARNYKMRATDSVTGAVFVWLLTTLSFSGTGYPGPNTAQNVQCLGFYDDGAGGGSSLTAPANPADDAKLTYANAGNLAYATSVKVAGSGAALAFGTAATAGEVRLPTAGLVSALRNDTLANVALIQKTAADLVAVGDTTNAAGVDIRSKAANPITLSVGGTAQATVSDTLATVLPPLQIGASGGAYSGVGLIRTGTLSANTTLMAVRVAGNDRAIFGYESSGSVVVIGSDSLDTTFRSEARLRLRTGASFDALDVTSAGSVFRFKGPVVGDASAADAFVRAPGSNSGNASGPNLFLDGGRCAGVGTPGGVVLRANVNDSTFLEGFRVSSSGGGASTLISFFGGTPAARQTDVGALTVSVGTADGTVADVGAAFNQTTLNNNFRDLADKINLLRGVFRAYNLTT